MENQKRQTLYYEFAPAEQSPIVPDPQKTALLIVDMQNQFVNPNYGDAEDARDKGMWEKWEYFYRRLENTVIPNNQIILEFFRKNGLKVTYGRIACYRKDGFDRSLVQRRPGWNNILLPIGTYGAEIIDELKALEGEIVVEKTTDSVLMGSNYERILRNLGIEWVVVTGVVTDQCVASTVRSLADAGFEVILVEDCCCAATQELHDAEIMIMNQIYCQVMNTEEVVKLLDEQLARKE